MKQAFRLSSAALVAFVVVLGALVSADAQLPVGTPESFVLQITSTAPTPLATPTGSPTPTPSPTPTSGSLSANSFAYDITGNGRFVVIESSGNIASETDSVRNNLDGNREIFLFDYAQRRIFQITNTRSALESTAAAPTLIDNIESEVSNNRPAISRDGRWIVFQSNAYSDTDDAQRPGSFDGNNAANRAALAADGNQEIFLYRVPDAADVPDLSSGADIPRTELAGGEFFRVTRTPASAPPAATFSADDNRFPTLNDDASVVAFVSSRNLATVNGGTNADLNPEIYALVRNPALSAADRNPGVFSQITNTVNPTAGINLVFNANPSLSADGRTIAFTSTAEFAGTTESTTDRGNAEIYLAGFNLSDVVSGSLRQVTRTPNNATGASVNVLSPGRRLSRNGNLLAFESAANLNNDGTANGAITAALATYIYNVGANTIVQVGPRPTSGGDALRFPTFTGDSSTIVFASLLNFRADGSAPTSATDGLNPGANAADRRVQLFSAPVPSSGSSFTFTRLTNVPAPPSALLVSDTRPLVSDSIRRIAFSYSFTEFGFGNSDGSYEAYYLIVPPATTETPAASPSPVTNSPLSFFTGASERPVVGASPAPTPPAVSGLAPGMLGLARATAVALAPSARQVDPASAGDDRRPQLPIELNGVSVSVGGAAAGLYFVSPTQINFVVPVGLLASATPYPVVVYNDSTRTLIRGSLIINAAQPDVFTTTNGAGGRAAVLNVTNPCIMPTSEPFNVTTVRPKGGVCDSTETEEVATELLIMTTGVRNAARAQVSVQIRGASEATLNNDAIVAVRPSRTSGFDEIIVRLPASLRGAGDSTVVVTVTTTGGTFTSRPVETAPRITINP